MSATSYTLLDLTLANLVDDQAATYIETLDDQAAGELACGRLRQDIDIMVALDLVRRDATMRKMDGKSNEAQINLMMLLIQAVGLLRNWSVGPMVRENLVNSKKIASGRGFIYAPSSLTAHEVGEWLSDPDLYYEYQNVQYDVSALLK